MTCVKCRNCPDIKYKHCPSPNTRINGHLYCETKREDDIAACSQCRAPLKIGHFAYEPTWREFWCEQCLRDTLEELDDQ